MHYREVDGLPEVVSYPELVAGYRQTGRRLLFGPSTRLRTLLTNGVLVEVRSS